MRCTGIFAWVVTVCLTIGADDKPKADEAKQLKRADLESLEASGK